MLDKIINIIESPMKSLIATITGTVTGYIPLVTSNIMNVTKTNIDTAFQHTVWTFTIIVAVASIVSSIQKQRDRWAKNHPKQENKSLYDISEDDD